MYEVYLKRPFNGKKMMSDFYDMRFEKKHLEFLNFLNQQLTKIELEIEKTAIRNIEMLNIKLGNPNTLTSDYEYNINVDYFTKWSRGDSIHKFSTKYKGDFIQGENCLNDIETDWMIVTPGPKLNERCCYLYHDILDHGKLGEKIFQINSIWVDTVVVDQRMITLENNLWQDKKI